MVEMRVREDGTDVLVYVFRTIAEAGEMMAFLRDFFPAAQFVVQPLPH